MSFCGSAAATLLQVSFAKPLSRTNTHPIKNREVAIDMNDIAGMRCVAFDPPCPEQTRSILGVRMHQEMKTAE
jgi:hypothetical protein